MTKLKYYFFLFLAIIWPFGDDDYPEEEDDGFYNLEDPRDYY